jgi:hypothetical protein
MTEIQVNKIDEFEGLLAQLPPVKCELKHEFKPGWYNRTIFMPAGLLLTSKIHRSSHQFEISKGRVMVMINDITELLVAPYTGLTKPGTRRIILVLEDTVWTTFHKNDDDCQDLEELERRLIYPHDNPYLSEDIKIKNNLTQKKKEELT